MIAPAQVLQGEPFNVEVVVDSNHDDEKGRVEVYRGDIKVAEEAGEAQEAAKTGLPSSRRSTRAG